MLLIFHSYWALGDKRKMTYGAIAMENNIPGNLQDPTLEQYCFIMSVHHHRVSLASEYLSDAHYSKEEFLFKVSYIHYTNTYQVNMCIVGEMMCL